jgi:hypothetical protein
MLQNYADFPRDRVGFPLPATVSDRSQTLAARPG